MSTLSRAFIVLAPSQPNPSLLGLPVLDRLIHEAAGAGIEEITVLAPGGTLAQAERYTAEGRFPAPVRWLEAGRWYEAVGEGEQPFVLVDLIEGNDVGVLQLADQARLRHQTILLPVRSV